MGRSHSPFRVNALFGPGPEPDLNACVGRNGGPYDFQTYSSGYLRSGRAIIESVRRMDLPVDLAVYPITFCLRHGIELGLKHLLERLPALRDEPPIRLPTHKLTPLWSAARQSVVGERELQADPRDIRFIDQLVPAVEDFDPVGQVFRYPVDGKDGCHLEDAAIINVGVLDLVLERFDTVSQQWSWQLEAISEARAEWDHGLG